MVSIAPSRHQLQPLHINAASGECFLRLLAPHQDIIITPPRLSDVDAVYTTLNTQIYLGFRSMPNPYTRENAEVFVKANVEHSNAVLAKIASGPSDGSSSTVGGCPLRAIRKILEDGSDVHIGYIKIYRLDEMRLARDATGSNDKMLQERNDTLPAGDPGIVWSITDWMNPDWNGKGIMTAAIGTVIREWAVPRMGAHQICVSAFDNNTGSRRVFEKNGFKVREFRRKSEFVRGEWRGICILDWDKE